MFFMSTDYSHSTKEIQIFRPGDSPQDLQLLESLFHNVEGFVFLWERKTHQTSAEAGIRSVETGARDSGDTDFVDQPISEGHIVVAASEVPEVCHHIVGAFGSGILEAVLFEDGKHACTEGSIKSLK